LWQYLKTYTTDIYESKQLRLMITLASTGESAGIADLMNFDPLNNRAEMGLYVASKFRGKGIAKATIALLQQYVTQHLGIKQIYVKIIADHTSTIMLHEECGFKQAGTLRSWVKRGKEYFDVVIMQWLSC
ncbi:MAG: GNAT family N-acetyltransferase, partial [Muribaculaceae bacterium]|nr:GNAT family N-acetyltransferase [Muribaculaceae bacterium]